MSLNVELLEQSFDLVAPRAQELADRFYQRLFSTHPELVSLFRSPMEDQKRHLVAALTTIVKSLRQPEKLTEFLEQLGIRHIDYGVRPEHYPVVGENLLAVLAEIAESAWTPELERTWGDAYGAIQAIIYGALERHTSA